jgi:general L-amino acid transport system permease protein
MAARSGSAAQHIAGRRDRHRACDVVGFLVGIARLSRTSCCRSCPRLRRAIRNVPLLLQLLFWYNAVLKALPDLRDSWTLPAASISITAVSLRLPVFGPAWNSSSARSLSASSARSATALGAQKGAHWRVAGRAGRARAHHRAAGHRVFPRRHAGDAPPKGRFNIRGGWRSFPNSSRW